MRRRPRHSGESPESGVSLSIHQARRLGGRLSGQLTEQIAREIWGNLPRSSRRRDLIWVFLSGRVRAKSMISWNWGAGPGMRLEIIP